MILFIIKRLYNFTSINNNYNKWRKDLFLLKYKKYFFN